MHLGSNEAVERPFGLGTGLTSFSEGGTWATQLLVKSSERKAETIAAPKTADKYISFILLLKYI